MAFDPTYDPELDLLAQGHQTMVDPSLSEAERQARYDALMAPVENVPEPLGLIDNPDAVAMSIMDRNRRGAAERMAAQASQPVASGGMATRALPTPPVRMGVNVTGTPEEEVARAQEVVGQQPQETPNIRFAGGGGQQSEMGTIAAMQPRSYQVGTNTFQPVSQQVHVKPKYTQEELDQLALSEDVVNAAAFDVAGLRQEGAEKIAEEQRRLDAERKRVEQQALLKQREREDYLRQKEEEFKSTIEEASVQDRVDKNAYFANLSTGEKVFNAILLVASGAASGMQGQVGNQQWESIKEAWQADLQNQRENAQLAREAKRDRVAGSRSLYEMAKERMAGEQQAEAAANEIFYQQLAREMENFKTEAMAPAERANLEMLQKKALAEAKQAQIQRRRDNEDEYTEARKYDQKKTVTIDPRQKLLKELELQGKLNAAALKANGIDPELYIPGLGIQASSKESEAIIKDASVAYDKGMYAINRLREARAQGAKNPLDRTKIRVSDNDRMTLVAIRAKDIAGGFAASESDMAQAQKLVPPAGEWTIADVDQVLTGLEEGLTQGYKATLKAHSAPPRKGN